MITKAALAKELKGPAGLSYRASVMCLDVLLEAIARGLSKGETVELRGFGSFGVNAVKPRRAGINGMMTIPAHGRISFRPCQKLRDAVWNYKQG
ncbi:MAG: HU family DNA-binding protein [Treponema sp.]|jgi:integration host factor subunit beta|nr:HU family DNA-binding protein [Treponema sp.]